MNGRGTSKITNKGFSLIEMSVVIIIIGLITAAAFSMLTANLEITQYTNTKAKLNTIVTALQRFYAANNRLPCPAQGTLKLGDATYGQEIFSGLCDRAVTAANNTVPAGTYAVDSGGGNWVRQGAIPSRALGLPDSMMYDDYGNKFSYAVTEKFTTSSVAGVITVNDGKGVNIKTDVAMVVFSHGRDAKGAYNAAGVRGMVCDSGVHLDKENCDADAVFTDTTYNASVDGANWYDDAIVWADKNLTINLLPAAFASGGSSASADCGARTPAHGYRMFITDETWCPPSSATYPLTVKAVAVGGGSLGSYYNDGYTTRYSGGASGLVRAASISLADSSPISIKIGAPGFVTYVANGGSPISITNQGSASYFGGYLFAEGASGAGGSGGGAFYTTTYTFYYNYGGGSNGSTPSASASCPGGGGCGQGTFVSSASTIRNSDGTTVSFSLATFTAGAGGAASVDGYGYGGGGLIINGYPNYALPSPNIAKGFGAGGGAGGTPPRSGVVYIEW